MNEKAITLTIFFISVFLLYQIRFIVRFRKLRKINNNVTEKGFVLGVYFPICECCCDLYFDRCCRDRTERQLEKIADRKRAAFERKTTERRIKEQKEYLSEIEQKKKGRKERVEVLRASGYTATEKDRHKVIELLSVNPKTNLLWTSNATRLPIEKIVIILENEEDFEIRDEYILNKKIKPKVEFLTIEERAKRAEELKEDKRKIAEKICPNCENPFETGSDFCPNCGFELWN